MIGLLRDIVLLAGVAIFLHGINMLSTPCAYILGGALLVVLSVVWYKRQAARPDKGGRPR